MKIQKISISKHRIPVSPPFPAAWDSRPRGEFEAVLVSVEGDNGLVGYGSGDALYGFSDVAPLFLGQDVDPIQRNYGILENISFHASRCWPLDVALWDLKGKAANQPIFRLLGGENPTLPLYASTGSLRTPAATVEQVAAIASQGYGAVKLRFGRPQLKDDFAVLEAVVDSSPLKVMVDCNQGWRMPWDVAEPWGFEKAKEVALELQRHNVVWMEEPLHRGNYVGMQRLAEELDMWIAGAEMTRDRHEVEHLLASKCLDVLQTDVVVSLGITGMFEMGELAKKQGIRFTPHTWGNGLGLMANAHVAAAVGTCPYLEYPLDLPEWSESVRDFFLARPLEVSSGNLVLSESPGLGLELDWDKLRSTQVDSQVFTA